MLNFLPKPLIGLLSFCMYFVNTLFWAVSHFITGVVKTPPSPVVGGSG